MTIVKDDKDRWDKLAIILAPVGGLLTALAVASLGIFGSRALDQQQSSEAKLRLYSELMSKREESEATLRKEMFQSIIGSFFDAQSTSLEAKLLKMELLAQNFHEALNLTPLFQHMRREIAAAPIAPPLKRHYEGRLSELAREITRKQMIVLESGGQRFDWTVLLSDSLIAGTKTETLEDVELTLDNIKRRFRVTLYQVDTVAAGDPGRARDRDAESARRVPHGVGTLLGGVHGGILQFADDRQHPAVQRPARRHGAHQPEQRRRRPEPACTSPDHAPACARSRTTRRSCGNSRGSSPASTVTLSTTILTASSCRAWMMPPSAKAGSTVP